MRPSSDDHARPARLSTDEVAARASGPRLHPEPPEEFAAQAESPELDRSEEVRDHSGTVVAVVAKCEMTGCSCT